MTNRYIILIFSIKIIPHNEVMNDGIIEPAYLNSQLPIVFYFF